MLKNGFTHIIDEGEFDQLIASRKPLRIKAGFDPTAPDLHLGHAVLLMKLRQFQDAGHTVVMIIGDTTASIGDPTGRNVMRPPLTSDEIQRNSYTYMDQAFRILDRNKTIIRHNSDWFNKMSMQDILKMFSSFTLSQMTTRDDFRKRTTDCTPIFIHELVYPMLQAYDSFHEQVDIELGGNDQFYNLMMGRMFMHEKGMKSQVIATVPLLLGTDGVEKMSKSKGNHIGLVDTPFDVYSKVMSISDATANSWWATLFNVTSFDERLTQMQRKLDLAFRVTSLLHCAGDVVEASNEWNRVFSNREKPTAIPVVTLDNFQSLDRRLDKMIAAAGLATSISEATRLVRDGAVLVNGVKISNPFLDFPLLSGIEVKVGRKWMRIVG